MTRIGGRQNGWVAFSNDPNSLIDAITGRGVNEGLEVSESVSPGMTVLVDVGSVYIDGSKVEKESPETLIIDASDPTNPRKDIVTIDADGNLDVIKGEPAAPAEDDKTGPETYIPIPPNIPDGEVILAEVWVDAGVTAIYGADVTDRRVVIGLDSIGAGLEALINEKIEEAVAGIMLSIGSSIILLPLSQESIVQGTWNFYEIGDLPYPYVSASGGDGDGLRWYDFMAQGVYDIEIVYAKSAICGKLELTIDGIRWALIDEYTAGVDEGQLRYRVESKTIASPGVKDIRIRANGKNESSPSYYIAWYLVKITRHLS